MHLRRLVLVGALLVDAFVPGPRRRRVGRALGAVKKKKKKTTNKAKSPATTAGKGFGAAPSVVARPPAKEEKEEAKKEKPVIIRAGWWLDAAFPEREAVDAPARGALTAWIAERNGSVDGVAVAPVDAGRTDEWGLVATRDLAAGTVVLEVPRALIVDAAAAPDVKGASVAFGDDAASLRLALWLLLCEDEAAEFRATLPRAFPGHPIYWDDAALAVARGSSLKTQVDSRRAALAGEYDRLCRSLAGFRDRVTLPKFAWAATCVESRSFELALEEGNDDWPPAATLVPAADMANHARDAALRYAFEGGAFKFVTRRPVSEGSELTVDYGAKSNDRFLMNYGFALEKGNVDDDGRCPDAATLVLRLEDGRLATWKVTARYDGAFTSFVQALRSLFPLPDAPLLRKVVERADGTVAPLPAAVDREREVIEALGDIAANYLANLPTTTTLGGGPGNKNKSPHHRDAARIFVESERRVLDHYVRLSQGALRCLDRLERGEEEIAFPADTSKKGDGPLNDHLRAYVRDLEALFPEDAAAS